MIALMLALPILLCADANAPAKPFDPHGIGLLRTIAPGGDPNGAAFTPDGRRLAVGVGNGAVIYETEHWRELRRLEGHPQGVLAVAWSPDGKTLAAGGLEGAVVLWDAATGALLRKLEGHTSYVGALAFSPDGKSLVSGSHDGAVRVWDPSTGAERGGPGAMPAAALSVAFSRDGRRCAIGLGNGEVRVWRAEPWEEERSFAAKGGGNVLAVGFTRDGSRVAAATETALTLGESHFEIATAGLGCLRLTPDERYAVVGASDTSVRVHDLLHGGKEVARLQHHTAGLSGLAIRPDGRVLVTIGHDRHLKIWGRVPGGTPKVRPKGFCGIRVQADALGRVVVADVIAGTAAQAAGLQAGDSLKTVGGAEVRSTAEAIDRIGSYFEGDEVEFGTERGGESRVLKFRLGKRPDDLEN